MTFLQWLVEQETRRDPVGDLARDVARDRNEEVPKGVGATERQWRTYLYYRDAYDEAFAALAQAWKEYRMRAAAGAQVVRR